MRTAVDEELVFKPFRLPAKLVALLFLFVLALAVFTNAFHPYVMDFISYWAASVLAIDGNAVGAYDLEVHREVQAGAVALEGMMPFPYPPLFLLLILPFGLLSYPVAAALWNFVTFAGYFAAARRLAPHSGWLAAAFPPVLINGLIGQNGFLTAGIFIAGLVLLPKRPFVAGLVLGCLILKPHLGLVLPLAFIAGRQWRAFIGAACSSVALFLLGFLIFGLAAHNAWIDQIPLYADIVSRGLVGWHKMASVYASLRLAGMSSTGAWTLHILVALVALTMTWLVWRGKSDMAAKAALLSTATVLVSPYLYVYDTILLIVPFFWLARVETNRILLVILWCMPFISLAQNWGYNDLINLTPLLSITLLFLICRRQLTWNEILPSQRGKGGLQHPDREVRGSAQPVR